MSFAFSRALRTSSSERFIVHEPDGTEVGAVDLHYLADGTVSGTLILLEEKHAAEQTVVQLLKAVDELLLPTVSLEDDTLAFTVIVGRVLGTFVPEETAE